LQTAVNKCDVVIASHPYLALVGFGHSADHVIKIYEAHNVEYDAKTAYYRGATDSSLTRCLLEDVQYGEALAAFEADYVTTVSSSDADRLTQLYGISRSKITIVPNGVAVASYPLLDQGEKKLLRDRLDLASESLGVFLGSAYPPNVEAYLRTRQMLAEAGYSGLITVIGSIKDGIPNNLTPVPFQERWLGFIDEELKVLLLSSADFALQLMYSGAGTNLKLFDYMAARVLIVGNSFGTRGLPDPECYWPVETSGDLRAFLEKRPWCTEEGERRAARARAIAEQQFDWRIIAGVFCELLRNGGGHLGKLRMDAGEGHYR
jgi:glycosyltransferase involved in cell wall biosynthesis